MIRLIALDMDGTLLNSRMEISETNKKAITLAVEKGARVVLCSGRPIQGLVKYLERLDLYNDEEFLIGYNGAILVSAVSKKVLFNQSLTGRDAKEIARAADALGANCIVHYLDRAVTPRENYYSTLEATVNGIPLDIVDIETIGDGDMVPKVLFLDYEHILDGYIDRIPEQIRERFTLVRTAPFFLEVLQKGLSKYSAISHLAEVLGIDNDEIIAIGDSENDYEMVKYVGNGVAMGNAYDSVKQVASFITRTEEEDGVAYALNRFMDLGMTELE